EAGAAGPVHRRADHEQQRAGAPPVVVVPCARYVQGVGRRIGVGHGKPSFPAVATTWRYTGRTATEAKTHRRTPRRLVTAGRRPNMLVLFHTNQPGPCGRVRPDTDGDRALLIAVGSGVVTEPASYSISVRVRRVTVEDGFVKVPVTDAVMNAEPTADGKYRLDGAKVMDEAARLAAHLAEWRVEEQDVSIHPIQQPPDDV